MKRKFIIYQGLILPSENEGVNYGKEFFRSQRALRKLNEIDLRVENCFTSKLKISEVKRVSQNLQNAINSLRQSFSSEVYYKFEILINAPKEILAEENEIYFELDLFKRFYDFLMILNICRVGGFNFGNGVLKQSSGFLQMRVIYSNNFHIHFSAQKKKWPKFENLGIESTWSWFTENIVVNNSDRISSSNLSRAYNALSNVFGNSNDSIKLFWTMVGIEAIYVEGNYGITNQITKKAQMYLGEISEFKKRLTKMYEYRSKFLHGKVEIPNYFQFNEDLEIERFNDETFEVLITSLSLLLATIQKMASERRRELNFVLELLPKSST